MFKDSADWQEAIASHSTYKLVAGAAEPDWAEQRQVVYGSSKTAN